MQKIDIVYSKTAKKIDVKKVKRAMWDIMSSISCDTDKVRPILHIASFPSIVVGRVKFVIRENIFLVGML